MPGDAWSVAAGGHDGRRIGVDRCRGWTVLVRGVGVARVFEHVAAVAGSVVALTWVLFALSYTGRRDSLDLRTVGVFSVEPAVYAVSVVTDLGGWAYRVVETSGTVTGVVVEVTPSLRWFHLGYTTLVLGYGVYLFAAGSLSTDGRYRTRTAALVGGWPSLSSSA